MNDVAAPETQAPMETPVAPVETSPNSTSPESLLGKDLAPAEPPAETKPEEPPVVEPFSFEKVTLPENLVLPDEAKAELTELATKHKLSPESASELLSLHAKFAQQQQTQAMQAWHETQKTWVNEIKSDPEFTGEKLQQAQAVIAKALDEFGGPEVRAAFDLTGAGSNPAIFRVFYKMAKALSEGSMTAGAPGNGGPKSLADVIYGS